MTALEFGLARYRTGAADWQYLALPGGILRVAAGEVWLFTRRYLEDSDYRRLGGELARQLRAEEAELSGTVFLPPEWGVRHPELRVRLLDVRLVEQRSWWGDVVHLRRVQGEDGEYTFDAGQVQREDRHVDRGSRVPNRR